MRGYHFVLSVFMSARVLASATTDASVLSFGMEEHVQLRKRYLPEGSIIGGYAPRCDNKVLEMAIAGVNVIYWSFIHLGKDPVTQKSWVNDLSLNIACIADISRSLIALNLATTHMATVGGCNAPHIRFIHLFL